MGCELGALQLVHHLPIHSEIRDLRSTVEGFHLKLLRSCQIKHLSRESDRAAFCLRVARGDVK